MDLSCQQRVCSTVAFHQVALHYLWLNPILPYIWKALLVYSNKSVCCCAHLHRGGEIASQFQIVQVHDINPLVM